MPGKDISPVTLGRTIERDHQPYTNLCKSALPNISSSLISITNTFQPFNFDMITCTRNHILATGLLFLFATTYALNVNPHVWGSIWPFAQFMAVRFGGASRAQSLMVAAQGGTAHIFDIISECRTQDGQQRDGYECAQSVTATAFAMGASVLAYRATGSWSKRDIGAIDSILSLIPAEISNVKLHGEPMANLTSMNVRKRQAGNENNIDVDYNGPLPLTFIVHHEINGSDAVVPIFHATDGRWAQIHHIMPVNNTLGKRNGFNGYNHIGAGGLKVQANSDPVAYWDDVMNWLYYGGSDEPPMSVILGYEKTSYMIGHAFETNVNGYLDGQFAFEEESNGFGSNFETDWNWCFGVYPNNCP